MIAQSGGPTAVMNASVAGAVRAARRDGRGVRVLGARFGAEGLLAGDCVDLSALTDDALAILERTPGAALGSSRHRPSDSELERIVSGLRAQGSIGVLMVGGNDTAETLQRIDGAARAGGASLACVGIPKTIDNDLPHMDHCPGYGSAARYVALAARESGLDTAAMRHGDPVKVIEVMGRNAGWLAASSALGRDAPRDAPQVIFLPERPRSLRQMVDEVRSAHAADGYAVVVICENQRDPEGAPLAGGEPIYADPHGHPYYESPGAYLARVLQRDYGLRARYERPGSLERTSALTISSVDLTEAEAAGAEAARRALQCESNLMIRIERTPTAHYGVTYGTVPLEAIAHQERRLPADFIADSGTNVTDAFVAYARPLIGEPLPAVVRLLD